MIKVYGQTHVGLVKPQNEDSWLLEPMADSTMLALVADGVSGSKHGEQASQQAVATFSQLVADGKLSADMTGTMRGLAMTMAVQRAHNDIAALGEANPEYKHTACTCTVAVADDEMVTVRQVGDSRLYHFRQGELTQKTHDQTVAEQLFAAGRINKEALQSHPDRHSLAQALGVEALNQPLQPDEVEFSWQSGDALLLCSDGLSDLVEHQVIVDVMSQQEPIQERVQQLIDKALFAGGRDNITVLILENN